MAYELTLKKQEELKEFAKHYGIHSSVQIPGHNFSGKFLDTMFERNNNPIFDKDSKYWKLVKVCKTNTLCTRWVIKINETLFTVVQGLLYKIGPGTAFFNTTDQKNGSCDLAKHIKQFPFIVDMETACDMFAAEYMVERIVDGRFANVVNR